MSLRELILRGNLNNGVANGGLGYVNGNNAVSNSNWNLLALPS